MAAIMDLFKTPSDKRIESATSEVQVGADWQTFIEIADAINSSSDGGKEILAAIKKRMQNKNAHVAELALTLLESCVKNCDARFHANVASKDFLEALVKMATKKDQKQAIREQGLTLIQDWAEAFDKAGRFPIFMETYQKLKQKGEMFPARDSATAAPIFTPLGHAHDKPANAQSAPQSSSSSGISISAGNSSSSSDEHKSTARAQATTQSGVNPLTWCSPEYILKIKTDLQVVVNSMKVLRDMLIANNDPQSLRQDGAVRSLISTLNEVRSRLSHLMVEIDNEQLMDFSIRFTEQISILLQYYHDKLNGMASGVPKDLDIPESIAQLEEKPKPGHSGGGGGGGAVLNLFDVDGEEHKGEHKQMPASQLQQRDSVESDPFAALAARATPSAKPKAVDDVFDGFDKLAMRQAQASGGQYIPPSPTQASPQLAPQAASAHPPATLALTDDPLGLTAPTQHTVSNVSNLDLEDLLSLTDVKPSQPTQPQSVEELMRAANETVNSPTSQKGLFDP